MHPLRVGEWTGLRSGLDRVNEFLLENSNAPSIMTGWSLTSEFGQELSPSFILAEQRKGAQLPSQPTLQLRTLGYFTEKTQANGVTDRASRTGSKQ